MEVKHLLAAILVFATMFYLFSPFSMAAPPFYSEIVSTTHRAAGDLMQGTTREDISLACYDRALQFSPADTSLHEKRGIVLSRMGRIGEAVTAYDQALATDPNRGDLYADKGSLLIKMERYRDALTTYQTARGLGYSGAQIDINEGMALIELGNYTTAIAIFDELVADAPKDAKNWINRGDALLTISEKMDENVLLQYQEIRNSSGGKISQESRSPLAIEPYEEAVHCYQRAIEIDPFLAPTVAFRVLARYQKTVSTFSGILGG
jgi:tetratricopeptide (TPR) repeat protein